MILRHIILAVLALLAFGGYVVYVFIDDWFIQRRRRRDRQIRQLLEEIAAGHAARVMHDVDRQTLQAMTDHVQRQRARW